MFAKSFRATGVAYARSIRSSRLLRNYPLAFSGACGLAFLIVVGAAGAALSQPAANQPATSDELRPVFAGTAEIADGKRVAEANCAACHGMDGIGQLNGVPNLAGQRPAFLYRALHAYISGARNSRAMSESVKFLSNDALIKASAYYASLEPAPPVAVSKIGAAPDPLQAGKAAAAVCSGCHGETGVSKMPGVPSLAGQNAKYLAAAISAYKGGQRKNDTMKAMVAAITDSGKNDIALYYSLQAPTRSQAPAKGNAKAGQAAAAVCGACHGAQGISSNPTTPSLAGLDAQFIAAALHGYKDGSRNDATMKGLAGGLSDSAIANLAAYYAGLQPHAAAAQKLLTTAQWVERCDRCHGVNGNSTEVTRPALAAQRADYLQKMLADYRSGARKVPEMTAMSSMLSDSDIRALAAYYASQKARSVVYVAVPGH